MIVIGDRATTEALRSVSALGVATASAPARRASTIDAECSKGFRRPLRFLFVVGFMRRSPPQRPVATSAAWR
jgi:hypothetical protein